MEEDLRPEEGSRPREGMQVGSYRLLQEIGRGGMGTVFLAEQDEPIRRRVAIKFIAEYGWSSELRARFDGERRLLASLLHPHIAQVFDAGATPDGQPFVVLEYVEGLELTGYVGEHRPDLEGRLALFEQLGEAVAYAHRKGVIHRDLKPTNVLVADDGQGPVVKVIDFGIAKVLDPEGRGGRGLTLSGQLIGTPRYMSPEQSGQGDGVVDVRSDIYSLGVILHELVTGRLPERLRGQPGTTSGRFSRAEVSYGYRAPSRRPAASTSPPDGFPPVDRVPVNLDWIILKCLADHPDDRFGSVEQLLDDIRRLRAGELATARPAGPLLQFGYLARKNRALVAAVAGLLIVGGAASVVSLRYAASAQQSAEESRRSLEQAEKERRSAVAARDEAEQAQKQAETVLDFMEGVIKRVRPGAESREQTIRDVLEDARRLASRLDDDPGAQIGILSMLADTFEARGEYGPSEECWQRALKAAESPSIGAARTAEVKLSLARMLSEQGRHEESLNRVDEIFEWLKSRQDGKAKVSRSGLSRVYAERIKALVKLGRVEEARATLANMERLLEGSGDGRIAFVYHQSASMLEMASGNPVEANRILEEGARALLRSNSGGAVERALASMQLAVCCIDGGELRKAESLLIAAHEFLEGEESAAVQAHRLDIDYHLAIVRLHQGDVERSVLEFSTAGEGYRKRYGERHPATMRARAMKAVALLEAKRGADAYELLEALGKLQGERHREGSGTLAGFAQISELVPKAAEVIGQLKASGMVKNDASGIQMLEALYGIWRTAAASNGGNPFHSENAKRGFMAVEQMIQLQQAMQKARE